MELGLLETQQSEQVVRVELLVDLLNERSAFLLLFEVLEFAVKHEVDAPFFHVVLRQHARRPGDLLLETHGFRVLLRLVGVVHVRLSVCHRFCLVVIVLQYVKEQRRLVA